MWKFLPGSLAHQAATASSSANCNSACCRISWEIPFRIASDPVSFLESPPPERAACFLTATPGELEAAEVLLIAAFILLQLSASTIAPSCSILIEAYLVSRTLIIAIFRITGVRGFRYSGFSWATTESGRIRAGFRLHAHYVFGNAPHILLRKESERASFPIIEWPGVQSFLIPVCYLFDYSPV